MTKIKVVQICDNYILDNKGRLWSNLEPVSHIHGNQFYQIILPDDPDSQGNEEEV